MIEWHKKMLDKTMKKIGLNAYQVAWIAFIKGILFTVIMYELVLWKGFNLIKHQLTFGVNIFNVFDKRYPHRVFPLTGTPDRPGEYYEDDIGIALSGSYYDRPYYYSNNREVNFFIRIEFD